MTQERDQTRVTGRQPQARRTHGSTASRTKQRVSARGKAKTAYELLARVAKAIERNPAQYNQNVLCGTAFCRAGWIVLLHDGQALATPAAVIRRAEELLGMREESAWPLFSTRDLFKPPIGARPGSPEYAAAGAAGVREFMAIHAAHLKARSLKGV